MNYQDNYEIKVEDLRISKVRNYLFDIIDDLTNSKKYSAIFFRLVMKLATRLA